MFEANMSFESEDPFEGVHPYWRPAVTTTIQRTRSVLSLVVLLFFVVASVPVDVITIIMSGPNLQRAAALIFPVDASQKTENRSDKRQCRKLERACTYTIQTGRFRGCVGCR
jgi:hypothetical protein